MSQFVLRRTYKHFIMMFVSRIGRESLFLADASPLSMKLINCRSMDYLPFLVLYMLLHYMQYRKTFRMKVTYLDRVLLGGEHGVLRLLLKCFEAMK